MLRDHLNRTVAGREVTDLATPLADYLASLPQPDRPAAAEVAEALTALAATRAEGRIMMAGTSNIARSAEDFARDVEPLLDVLEEQLVLLRLFTDMHASPGAVEVRIGSELHEQVLHQAAVVGAGVRRGLPCGDPGAQPDGLRHRNLHRPGHRSLRLPLSLIASCGLRGPPPALPCLSDAPGPPPAAPTPRVRTPLQ